MWFLPPMAWKNEVRFDSCRALVSSAALMLTDAASMLLREARLDDATLQRLALIGAATILCMTQSAASAMGVLMMAEKMATNRMIFMLPLGCTKAHVASVSLHAHLASPVAKGDFSWRHSAWEV